MVDHLPGPAPEGPLEADRLAALTDAALAAAAEAGSWHATLRVERIRTQVVVVRDGRLQTAADDTTLGLGVRVFHRNSEGFAASVATDVETAAACARQA